MQMPAKMPNTPKRTVVKLAPKGIPYALSIGTIYGRIAIIPENCKIQFRHVIITNGFSVRLRFMSFNLSQSVGFGWVHLIFSFSQFVHDTSHSVCSFKSLNSVETACGETKPLNHCSDFNASSERCFDMSHIGDSGVWQMKNGTYEICVFHGQWARWYVRNK